MALAASSSSDVKCSICWDDVSESCGRSVVRLQCSHLFHLDCIGSAFNASGVMKCPNCRVIENGNWRLFEDNISEGSVDEEIYDEDDQQFIDMQPRAEAQWLCPYQGGPWLWPGMLPSLGSQDVVEQPVICACNPNINHWSGQSVLTQISDTDVVHNLYYNWGQPAMFTSMGNHMTGANQASVPSATLRDAHNDSDGIPNLQSVGHQVILQHGNIPVYDNFRLTQPLSNSPLPEVHASMLSGRSGSNDLPGGLPAGHVVSSPEQTTNFYHVPSLSISTWNHPQAAFLVNHHVQERDYFPPFEHLPEDIGPSWGLFN